MSKPQQTSLQVECYAGYRADEEPQRFSIGEREVCVEAVLDRWLSPEHRYFKLRGNDDGIYILRHDLKTDRWEMTLYDSGRHDQGPLSST